MSRACRQETENTPYSCDLREHPVLCTWPKRLVQQKDTAATAMFALVTTGRLPSPDTHITCGLEQTPSWEANSSSTSHEILHILWNLKFHYRVHNSVLLVSILRQINPLHAFPSYLRSISTLSAHLLLGLPRFLNASGFRNITLYSFFFSHIRATCPTHLIFLIWLP